MVVFRCQGNTQTETGQEMKFVIRRAVAGLLLVPVVAVAYVAGYAVLVGLGAEATTDLAGAFSTGLFFGAIVAVGFAFATQLDKAITKVVGA
jgi:nitrate reductase NapE component